LTATRFPNGDAVFKNAAGDLDNLGRNGQTFRHTERILGVYNNGKNLILTLERKSWLIRFF
jgi:hypothetical protein